MKVRDFMKRGCAVILAIALVNYCTMGKTYVKANEIVTGGAVLAETVVEDDLVAPDLIKSLNDDKENASEKKDAGNNHYIVKMKTKGELKSVLKEHERSEEINDNGQDFFEANKMTSLELTSSEVNELTKNENLEYIEKDSIVEANTLNGKNGKEHKQSHEKKAIKHKKNQSDNEWNIQMINADQVEKNGDESKKIKIAVLDSGVDFANDISLKATTSLVPGEEELSPLFMDGTGHGNSVAGLIAATDDEKGITGINPYAEIYSIRVLDDENEAPVSRVVEGIYMAIEKDVNIINMSFGMEKPSRALEEAIQDAYEAGILIVASAGNTGDKGVQYPAAYDEVMAVGAVNKDGSIEEYSAKGPEVEIVAPGELVRSTGVLGDELVSSGTSLASPQVAAVASLIWQKDPDVSADFVRELLRNSANLYGDSNEYGYGLLDAKYAVEHYKKFKSTYKEHDKSLLSLENKSKIDTFEDTGCVEGNWLVKDHETMVPSENANVRKGTRFPDKVDGFSGLSSNPWWHGSYRSGNNYVKAYICATKIANSVGNGNGTNISYSFDYKSNMVSDINSINWKSKYAFENKSATKGRKRALIWGMAIHTLADTFAHSVYVYDAYQKRYRHLDHSKNTNPDNGWADDTAQVSQRWTDAREAIDKAMQKYNAGQCGSYNEYSVIISSHVEYYLRDLKKNIAAVDYAAGTAYASFSYTAPIK